MAIKGKGHPAFHAGIALFAAASIGFATAAQAACYPPENQLPRDQIENFIKNPSALLSSNPGGGGNLVSSSLKLVASDSATLPLIVQLLSGATPQQRSAIGAGLAAAVQACLVPDQAFAGEIQSQLAATGDRIALMAFVSGGGQDTATAATSPGAPASTAFVSGATQTTGNFQAINNTPLATQTTGGAGGTNLLTFSGSSSSSAAARNSARNSVSP